ncbi:hypothetical protein [Modicisalibacter luteus]|uniref:Uncharacterized protein n=1 Tax=Modicisalibacter luteus TaxID=453962 RepID=A0ABV7M2Z0_9GAMM|nr:hypothetical protein [Halomonas lutea]GHA85130.1 hypothetical protein GCM10007159_02750 [Halomonas lutea]
MRLPIVATLLFTFAVPALSAPPASFTAAKRIAEAETCFDRDMTFYYGCDFTFDGGPDLNGCSY